MAAAMALSAGSHVGPYVVSGPLGAGGMGEVYRARDTRLGRDVALKLLPASAVADPDRLQRFEQEARATAALNHPNILALYDIGRSDHGPFLVTELLEGETLRSRAGSRSDARAQSPGHRGASSARAGGRARAGHRAPRRQARQPVRRPPTATSRSSILDWSSCRTGRQRQRGELPTTAPPTSPGVVLGTVGYMAPEQVIGRAADHRADIFALGAVLYELVTGRAPSRATRPRKR